MVVLKMLITLLRIEATVRGDKLICEATCEASPTCVSLQSTHCAVFRFDSFRIKNRGCNIEYDSFMTNLTINMSGENYLPYISEEYG